MNSMSPKFSVIIPLYNKEKYIKRAIDSVLNQSFQNFELIVVNDGSIDKSLDVVRSICSEKIVVIDKDNGGESSARNAGIKKAKGEFVCFLDGDDEYLENHLKILRDLIEEFPTFNFFATNSYDSFKLKEELKSAFPISTDSFIVNDYYVICKNRSFVTSNTACIRKEVLDFNNLFDENLKFGPDLEMWFRLCLDHKLVFCSVPTAIYRREAEQRVMSDLIDFNKEFIEKLVFNIQFQPNNFKLKKYVEAKLVQECKRHLRLNKNSEVRKNILQFRRVFSNNLLFAQWLVISFLPFKHLSEIRLYLRKLIYPRNPL
ncbi:glycosyltransferase family A protein [Lutimonas vermicola]|uniref:Glycosyltransferase family A protein n=1 Tax=Lutimonas vermicola TaxID=414288 RepID=A0ABU9L0Y7_9FLAO